MNEKRFDFGRRCGTLRIAVFAAAFAVSSLTAASAQIVKAPRYQGSGAVEAPVKQINLPPLPPAISPHGVVVENVVARVNDQIISRSDVDRSEEQLEQESAQQNLSPADLASRQKDMLRDMIDQQLLLSKAKELGLNADAEVIRRLDDIRKQNKLDSMDDLEKAARQQGVSFEDFKAQIRNQILTQQVVRDEVGRRLQTTQAEQAKYYEAHKKDFEQPEQVRLSEILVPLPDTASPAEIEQAETKANGLKSELMKGGDFAEVAKKNSGGPTAAQGGELGLFKRGALAKVIEDQTFALAPGESTQPIRTRQGFVILKVNEHQEPGAAPMKDVEPQIQEALYMNAMQPALRAYLTKLRENAYVDIQPGFIDSGASAKESKPVFTAYAPPVVKKKKVKNKARFDRHGAFSTASAAAPAAAASKPVVSSPDTTGGRTLTGAEAAPVDQKTGLAVIPASSKPGKKQKGAKREKVRFGQAPRTALAGNEQAETTPAATTPATPGSGAGGSVAPGAVMASDSNSLSTSGQPADTDANPLEAKAGPKTKTRFAARAVEHKEKKVAKVSAREKEKVAAQAAPMTDEEKAAAQTQATPLGLSGDTGPKKKVKKVKVKKVKGAPKEPRQPKKRLEEKKPEAPPPPPDIAPTANPALAPTAAAGEGKAKPTQPTPPPTTPPNPQP
ncbi:PpiC-type peptidyl-prolyl cis-trans isomerase [Granulicella tundricola MP5ACTX9]|uniref:PpiC-type peptidyl-prolyl cis-trans isomerase n=1 Tax=Granulicella tundricola (strain ATCC BAA-1859 / DSM 23138 / MP5ACTX9) TaxID=1198114 RepID=E8X3J0_GRATM|nr:PpiC-type peptidyl-prolyl cis-trans isomerase [Granulicella tundricola MP5ACTX9]